MEQDKPKNLLILGYVIVIIAFMVLVIVGVDQYFRHDVQKEYARKVLQVPAVELRNLGAEEDAKLNRYQWVDQSKGLVRIPLDHAVELTLRDWSKRPEGLVPIVVDGVAPSTPPPSPAAPATAPTPVPGTPAGETTPSPATGAPGSTGTPGGTAPDPQKPNP